jgi:hypothetical protein
VSASSHELKRQPDATEGAVAVDPFHNPSYPKRTHFHERDKLEESLRLAETRLNAARQKLDALSNHAQHAHFVKLWHQMQGARDQIAETVRRLPLEAGDLYEDDKERYTQAVSALDRLWRKWESVAS